MKKKTLKTNIFKTLENVQGIIILKMKYN